MKSAIHIDYRPGKELQLEQLLNFVHDSFNSYPDKLVEAVSIRNHYISAKTLKRLIETKTIGFINVRVVYEHTQLTFIRTDSGKAV